MVNGRPALRVQDMGMHAVCCGPNMWTATAGSATVFINGKAAHREGDAQQHCGGSGKLQSASTDVIVGDGSGGGGGGGGGGGSGGGGSGGSSGGGSSSSQQGQSSQGQSSQGSGSSSSGSNQSQSSSSSNNQNQSSTPGAQPQKVAAQWKIVWDDDQSSVGGVKVKFEPSSGKASDLTGASNSVPGLDSGTTYGLTLEGTSTLKGKVTDHDGNPVKGAKVHIERLFGPAVDIETDGNGEWKADGFVEGEPHEVTVHETPQKAEGTLTDENGKPMANVRAWLRGDAGTAKQFTSDASGKYSVEGLLPGEGYHIEVIDTGRKR